MHAADTMSNATVNNAPYTRKNEYFWDWRVVLHRYYQDEIARECNFAYLSCFLVYLVAK